MEVAVLATAVTKHVEARSASEYRREQAASPVTEERSQRQRINVLGRRCNGGAAGLGAMPIT